MKANKKVLSEMVNVANNLAEKKEFDVVSKVHFLAVELCGLHGIQDKVEALELELKNQQDARGERKKAVDLLLKDLWAHNVVMIRGAGVSKCAVRIELTKVLDEQGIKEKTRSNILTSIEFSLRKKRPYDIHHHKTIARERELFAKNLREQYTNESIALMQKQGIDAVKLDYLQRIVDAKAYAKIEQFDKKETDALIKLHNEIQTETLKLIESIQKQTPSATTPPATTPPATTPPATTPPATTPPATTPPATTPSATTKKSTRLDYCKDASAIARQLFDATQFRKCLNDSDSAYYDEIIENIKNITTILATMAKDKDYTPNMDDMDDMDDMDNNLDIDTEMVD